jgi:hypothetical protein
MRRPEAAAYIKSSGSFPGWTILKSRGGRMQPSATPTRFHRRRFSGPVHRVHLKKRLRYVVGVVVS